jgi:hypothetical protein
MLIPPRESWNPIAAVWRWWDGSTKDRERPEGVSAPAHQCTEANAVTEPTDPLRERMRALHLDPNEILNSETPAATELRRLCARCESRSRCMRDLVDEFADPAWQAWRDYCPNATALSVLNTLHGCDEITPKSA